MQREIVQQPAQLCLGGLPLAGGGSPRGQRGDFQGPPACLLGLRGEVGEPDPLRVVARCAE